MSDWLTYTPETFLMFSERTYRRLFEMHNAALWPAQVAAILAGIVILVLLFRRSAHADRSIAAALATTWLIVAAAWFWTRFSTIHTGGQLIAAAFAIEAAGLLWFAAQRNRIELTRPARAISWIATAILAYGLFLQPLLGRALGRPWTQSEVFGLAPDPTVAATIGSLALARHAPWFLWVIPIGWSLFSGMTLWAMQTPDAWLPPTIAITGATLSTVHHRRTKAAAKPSNPLVT